MLLEDQRATDALRSLQSVVDECGGAKWIVGVHLIFATMFFSGGSTYCFIAHWLDTKLPELGTPRERFLRKVRLCHEVPTYQAAPFVVSHIPKQNVAILLRDHFPVPLHLRHLPSSRRLHGGSGRLAYRPHVIHRSDHAGHFHEYVRHLRRRIQGVSERQRDTKKGPLSIFNTKTHFHATRFARCSLRFYMMVIHFSDRTYSLHERPLDDELKVNSESSGKV